MLSVICCLLSEKGSKSQMSSMQSWFLALNKKEHLPFQKNIRLLKSVKDVEEIK